MSINKISVKLTIAYSVLIVVLISILLFIISQVFISNVMEKKKRT